MDLYGTEKDISRKQREIEFHRGMAAAEGEAWGWTTPAGRKRVERRLAWMQRAMGFKPGMHVLELGCGLGFFSEEIAKTGVDLTAIDLSEDLLAKASQRIPGVHFLRQDAEYLDFPEASFDAVVGISMLHHVSLERTLQGIYRILKPGRGIFFTEPNMLNPQIFLERNIPAIRKWAKNSPDETAFFRWQLRKKIEAVGFKSVKVQPFDFLHPLTSPSMMGFVEKVGSVIEQIPILNEIAGSLAITAQK